MERLKKKGVEPRVIQIEDNQPGKLRGISHGITLVFTGETCEKIVYRSYAYKL